jgi:hypothetical protein
MFMRVSLITRRRWSFRWIGKFYSLSLLFFFSFSFSDTELQKPIE